MIPPTETIQDGTPVTGSRAGAVQREAKDLAPIGHQHPTQWQLTATPVKSSQTKGGTPLVELLPPKEDQPTLKDQLQRDLDLSRGGGRTSNSTCSAARGGTTAAEDGVRRVSKVGAVEEVEQLRAELQSHLLRQPGILDERQV